MHNVSVYVTRLFRFWLGGFVIFFLFLLWAVLFHFYDIEKPVSVSSESPDAGMQAIIEPIKADPVVIPSFDGDKDEYLLLAFPLQGVFHITDAEPYFTLLPPEVVFNAQLIKRGPLPEPVTEGVHIRYTIEGNMVGQDGKPLPPGELVYKEDPPGFVSDPIPLMPYTSDGKFMPYPTALLEAINAQGTPLITTRVTLPVSTEIGCRNCHTGPWKTDNRAGIGKDTAGDILAMHDRRNKTDFVAQTSRGETIYCQSCHMEGSPMMNLSTAIHGFHATMQLSDPESCYSCHPSSPEGSTQFFHDFHSIWGLDCTSCHGSMTEHAVSLLKRAAQDDNPKALLRLGELDTRTAVKPEKILPRTPWVNMPDCTGCHDFVKKPDPSSASAFNKWTEDAGSRYINRTENTQNIRCASCHGVQHSIYPSNNPIGDDRDNIQPLQYQNLARPIGADNNCQTCHTQPMPFFVHHDIVESESQ